jgi:hypothetical protein
MKNLGTGSTRKISGVDWLQFANAQRLAGQIDRYWYDRGYFVGCVIQKHGEMHCIRSVLVNGIPQTKRAEDKA